MVVSRQPSVVGQQSSVAGAQWARQSSPPGRPLLVTIGGRVGREQQTLHQSARSVDPMWQLSLMPVRNAP